MVAPPERSLLEIDEMKALIAANPSTGKEDHIRLLARLVDQFGAAGGVLAWNIFFWAGRSTKLEGGWLFKSRKQFLRETGLGIREFTKAREILRGERSWAGRTVRVLDEARPSRRTPAHYRLRLEDLAAALGVELRQPSTAGPDLPPNAEWSRGTAEWSRETAEWSPLGEQTSVSTNREDVQSSFVLNRTSEPDAPRRTLPPLMDDLLEEQAPVEPSNPELVDALRGWLGRNPQDHPDRKPPSDRRMQASWLASTVAVYGLIEERPTPAEVEAALASPELQGLAA